MMLGDIVELSVVVRNGDEVAGCLMRFGPPWTFKGDGPLLRIEEE